MKTASISPPPIVTQPEPTMCLVAVSDRLVLRVAVLEGWTLGGWFLDGEPAKRPERAAEA